MLQSLFERNDMPEQIDTFEEKELLDLELRDEKNVSDDTGADKSQSERFNITSYGADYTVDSLVKRVKSGAFFVPPFQRLYVWNLKQASKFIESLLLGLPIPGIFVFREEDTQKHLIIDGQQRLKTLSFFYSGLFKGKEFLLQDVREPWNGKSYNSLEESDRLRLDDSVIHTTVFRQDSPDDGNQSVYEVFERINSGGMKLSSQEIRTCVSFGKFTDLLHKMNQIVEWRSIYGPQSVRMKDEELILRFIAFYFELETYKRPFAKFLNDFLKKNKDIDHLRAETLFRLFERTVQESLRIFGIKAFRPEGALNTAVFDSVTVGLARRLDRAGPLLDPTAANSAYQRLLLDPVYQDAYRRSTADEDKVKQRMTMAISAFNNLT